VRGFILVTVDTRNEIRDFLTSRRAKLKAADVGLPNYGTRRVAACPDCDAKRSPSSPA
jgi:hypothetical protein